MKNIEIYAIGNAYKRLGEMADKARQNGNDSYEVKLPAKVAWTRRLNLDKIFKAGAIIEEALNDISKKYSDDEHSAEDSEGRRYIKEEYVKEYAKERAEVLDQETDVDIKKVKITDLGDVMLSDEYMDTIMFMLDEGDNDGEH